MTTTRRKRWYLFTLAVLLLAALAWLAWPSGESQPEDLHIVVGMGWTPEECKRQSPKPGRVFDYEDTTLPLLILHDVVGTIRLRGQKSLDELVLRNVDVSMWYSIDPVSGQWGLNTVEITRFVEPSGYPSLPDLAAVLQNASFTGPKGESVRATMLNDFKRQLGLPDGSTRYPDKDFAPFFVKLFREDTELTLSLAAVKTFVEADFSIQRVNYTGLWKLLFSCCRSHDRSVLPFLEDYRVWLAEERVRKATEAAIEATKTPPK